MCISGFLATTPRSHLQSILAAETPCLHLEHCALIERLQVMAELEARDKEEQQQRDLAAQQRERHRLENDLVRSVDMTRNRVDLKKLQAVRAVRAHSTTSTRFELDSVCHFQDHVSYTCLPRLAQTLISSFSLSEGPGGGAGCC